MSFQRPLSDMLTEILGGLLLARGALAHVRPRSIELSLPIEAKMREVDGLLTLAADVPVWRWRTDFDPLPGRLNVVVEESEA